MSNDIQTLAVTTALITASAAVLLAVVMVFAI
jgi:hypothetical protein